MSLYLDILRVVDRYEGRDLSGVSDKSLGHALVLAAVAGRQRIANGIRREMRRRKEGRLAR